ncbi:MAG: cysteine dioxygenase family protein [Planctomycetota bacterium]|nr:cysteine dioxygenase family protein [Planctomycetota bacterium]
MPDARPCADAYGAHARAHPAVHAFCDTVEQILRTTPADEVPDRVAEALAPVLATEGLLCDELREPGAATYRKHVLFACPEKHFTLVAIVWQPGQGTDIHGHTAWGAVGVYEGHPNVACYACEEVEGGRHIARETKNIHCAPGDTATVRPGLCDTHRIYNESDDVVITLHTYGLDLVADPDAINIHLTLAS